jgi:hypothetical protein
MYRYFPDASYIKIAGSVPTSTFSDQTVFSMSTFRILAGKPYVQNEVFMVLLKSAQTKSVKVNYFRPRPPVLHIPSKSLFIIIQTSDSV